MIIPHRLCGNSVHLGSGDDQGIIHGPFGPVGPHELGMDKLSKPQIYARATIRVHAMEHSPISLNDEHAYTARNKRACSAITSVSHLQTVKHATIELIRTDIHAYPYAHDLARCANRG